MVQNLSDVLKYSLSNPSESVTLKQELYYAQCYVAIQQQRYSDTIEVVWDIDQDALSCKGMKLLLQPLIENAIYHGAKENESLSTITIQVCRAADTILLKVSDTGTGMKAEQLGMVKLRLEEEAMEESHIGLKNVYKRLKLHYGDSVQFSIDSEWKVGTSITILIPYISMRDEHNS
jgi:two-component system sensor histidine kinase YesM